MNFIQEYNKAYFNLLNNNTFILDNLDELKNAIQSENSIESDTENSDKTNKQKSKKQKPNIKAIIEKIESSIKESEKNAKIILNTFLCILDNMKDNLLDSEGALLKVGILRWNNIPKYAEFAKFVKSTVVDVMKKIGD